MEPLTALALAGNVLQFVEFVGGLFKNTCKIYASTSGLTPENRHLQDICDKLGSFSTRLQCRSSISKGAPLSENSQALEECTAACKKDCDELLRIMRALAAKGIKGPKYWRSFSAALAHTLKSCDIQDLKTRIADRQRLMVLQLCAVSNENIQVISSQLQQLRLSISQWNTRNDTWLDKLADTERSLKNQVNRLARHESLHPDDIQSVCSGLTQLFIDTGDYQKAINILNTLDYEERPVRHSKIPDAHQVTFAWTLNETDATDKTAGFFRRWLIGDDGLFWVSGKPGSGKSTFMKFAAGHPDTRQFLQQWAGDRDLIVASHYFTIYGTEIQKSLEGLLRSLLYDILKGEPKLIEKFLPSRWKATIEQRPWTQHELDAVLRRITAESSFPVNMCFFIDGLDEYTGDHLDICQTLREISQSPFIKVCVSSRPWNVFEDALGDTPSLKLYMHDLTHNDIRDFTEHRLREHPRWKAFVEEANITTSDSLIEDVVDKSKGVFLWVFLVTRLLREGLNNDDSIQDLKRRVSSYPTDLEKFFKHILESVDPFYHEKMAGTLMLARDAKSSSLPVEIFMFHDLEYEDEDYAFKESTEPPHLPSRGEDYHKLILSISRRINGRCKGLLERCRRHMVFLHRTVFDFLRTPEMTAFLEEKAKKNFNPGLSLLQSSIAWMKRSRFDLHDLEYTTTSRRSYHFKESLEMILNYASLLEEESGSTAARVSALLDNLDSSIAKMSERGQIAREDKSIAVGMYRHQLLENGLHEYLQAKLASVPGYFNNEYADKDKSPLRFVLCHAPEYLAPYRTLLEMLLQNGCDPNRSHDKETPWTRCLKVYCQIKPLCDFFAALETGIFEVYLQHGADPNALVDVEDCQGQTVQIPAWFEFFRVAPHVKAEFQQAYERVLNVLLSDISSLHTSRHCDTDSSVPCELCKHNFQLARPMAIPDTLPDEGEFLFRVFEKAVTRTRRNKCAFDTCWFTECLSRINKDIENKLLLKTLERGRINPRKRLLEEELQPHKIIKTV